MKRSGMSPPRSASALRYQRVQGGSPVVSRAHKFQVGMQAHMRAKLPTLSGEMYSRPSLGKKRAPHKAMIREVKPAARKTAMPMQKQKQKQKQKQENRNSPYLTLRRIPVPVRLAFVWISQQLPEILCNLYGKICVFASCLCTSCLAEI